MEKFYLNKVHWKDFNEQELDELAKEIIEQYKVFPHYSLNFAERHKEFEKLYNYNSKALLQDGVIKQTMHGLSLAWMYFPHAWGVRCGNSRTPLEVFADKELFYKAIRKRLKYGTYINDSGIRKALKTYSGTQAVSNFRPTAAACIYQNFAPEDAKVWDMCGGYGGRLLGAVASPNISEYHVNEPCLATKMGLEQLGNSLIYSVKKLRGTGSIWINGTDEPAEESDNGLWKEYFDLCFSSPPYFDTEKYSVERTQSYIRYPTPEKWIDGFLEPMIARCYHRLKPGGRMVINVANVKSLPELENFTVYVAKQQGFVLEQELQLTLSKMMGTRDGKKFKYEPVFVFKKD